APLLRLHHEPEGHRVRFSHVRALDHDAVGVLQIPLRGRRPAPAEAGAQTGHRAAVSYPGLVFDPHYPQPGAEQLLDQVVLLDVHDLPVLYVDKLRAADGAVGADAGNDFVGGAGARLDLPRPITDGCLAQPELAERATPPQLPQIPKSRPALEQSAQHASWSL